MPYRDQATVLSWVSEFFGGLDAVVPTVTVLDKDFTSGPDSGLVVVSLTNASTVTYIQATVTDDHPTWVVTFEARAEGFDLDAAGVARLSADLGRLAALCEHLQQRTDEALAAKRS